MSFTAVILAAGTGSRLGARTADVPKPAVDVARRPLLAYDLAFVRRAGAARVAVVTGHRRDVSEPLARELGADLVLWNPRYAEAGNLRSLEVARTAGLCDGGFLLMNADHVYRPSIADVVAGAAATAADVVAFVDLDRSLGPDDMKVQLDDRRRVRAISKGLERWDAGYVGMTFVPAAAAADHARHSAAVLADLGDGVHVEAVLARMADDGAPAATADVSGHGWLEVDDADDLRRAEAALARDPWYKDLP